MKKRILALLLAVCISVSALALPASAAADNANTAVQTAITLGAMDQSQTGELSAAVTRGAFARMLVAFSAYRESVSAQGTSGTLFADVPSDSQWAPYIRIAVQQGWLNGYTDGSFRPDNAVTLEEACTAALKLMGYKMTDLSGSFPNAQLNKSSEIGLRTYLSRAQGEAMNYEDCAVLLYNALTATGASGSSYGSSLGFTVSDGQVDLTTVLQTSLEGPFVAGEGSALPFAPTSVYVNDKATGQFSLDPYDVYYYSESLHTVWIYTRRAAGRIQAVSPTASAPTAVTVAGNTYTLGSSSVASQISSLNGGGVGQVVTLLLGMNNVVAGAVTGDAADSVYYGVVTESAKTLVDEENGVDVRQAVSVMCTDGITRSVTVKKSSNYPAGWLVELTVNGEGETLQAISKNGISGRFDADATHFGDYELANDVEILDTVQGGSAGTVRPSRLSGVKLSSFDVRYYTLNDKGQIDRLILNDVTGDLWHYGVLNDVVNVTNSTNLLSAVRLVQSLNGGTDANSSTEKDLAVDLVGDLISYNSDSVIEDLMADEVSTSALSYSLYSMTRSVLTDVISGDLASNAWYNLTSNTGSILRFGLKSLANVTDAPLSTVLNYLGSGAVYSCSMDGGAQNATYYTSVKYPVLAGGVGVNTEGNSTSASGSVRGMAQLMPMRIDKIGAASVMSASGDRYETADDLYVYFWYGGVYYPTKLTSINTEEYTLTGWYDNFGCAAGKKVRVIIAVKND